MRTCQSCGKENPPDRDFCSCGEYLRWEPTGFVQAITPEMAAEAAAQAAPPHAARARARRRRPRRRPPPSVTPAAPVAPEQRQRPRQRPRRRRPPPPRAPASAAARPSARCPPSPRSRAGAAAAAGREDAGARRRPAAAPPVAVPRHEHNEPATIVLRAARGRPRQGRDPAPGRRARASASACWRWCATRAGSSTTTTCASRGCRRTGGRSIPARSTWCRSAPAAPTSRRSRSTCTRRAAPRPRRGCGSCKVVADSKANRIVAASAPLALHIQPYIETATTLRPQRKKGRRKATFDVTVANKANAPVLIALDGEDPDGELQFGFNRPPQEIPPGGSVTTQMQVKPPKQIWIGRAQDRRLEVKTVTGEEAAARAAAEPLGADVLAHAPPQAKKKWYKRRRAAAGPGRLRRRASTSRSCTRRTSTWARAASTCGCRSSAAPQMQGPQMGPSTRPQLRQAGRSSSCRAAAARRRRPRR